MNPHDLINILLKVEAGPNKGDEFSFNSKEKLVIGRDDSSQITIKNDYLISRQHCGIFFSESIFNLVDFESANGTFLNQKVITKEVLKDNDLIKIGNTVFRVDIKPVSKELVVDNEQKKQSLFSIDNDLDHGLSEKIENRSNFKIKNLLWEDKSNRVGLSIIVKGTFKIQSESVTFSDQTIPIFTEDIFYDGDISRSLKFESDLAPYKPRSDIVVVGNAYSPNKKLVKALDVGIKIGDTKSILRVFGNRKWLRKGNSSSYEISDPVPFSSMSLIYENAFGGGDFQRGVYCQENHIGRGCVAHESLKDDEHQILPNIEDPSDLITSWKSRPKPMGLGFYRKNWSPRIKYAGTYDEEYNIKENIEPPKDFSYRLYNGAHPDLQVDGYLKGNEKVELVNLSPKGRLIFNLPDIKPFVVVRKKKPEERETKNKKYNENHINMNLDTLVFIPDEDVFYQVFRGVYELDSIEDFQNLSVIVC